MYYRRRTLPKYTGLEALGLGLAVLLGVCISNDASAADAATAAAHWSHAQVEIALR